MSESVAEVQASTERVSAIASDVSTATIESLRARLLAERAASKEARLMAQKISERVSELQSRLNAEIENRRKAQLAMADVLKALKRKGHSVEEVIASYSSEKLEYSDIMAVIHDSKGTESDHSSDENAYDRDKPQETADPVDPTALSTPNKQECPEQAHSANQSDLHHEGDGISSRDESPAEGADDSSAEGAPQCSHSDVECRTMDGHERRDQEPLNQISELSQISESHNDDCTPETDTDDAPGKDTVKQSPGPTSVDESATKELDVKLASDASSTEGHHGKDRLAANGSFPRHHEQQFDKFSGPQMPYINGVAGFIPPDAYLGFYRTDGMPYNAAPRTINDHKLHDLHGTTEAAPFVHPYYGGMPSYFTNTKYTGVNADPLPMFYRAPVIPGHESVVPLADDKTGKLDDILTALQLARQQLTDRPYTSTTSFIKDDSSMPAAPSRKASAGGYYTNGSVYQQPVRYQGLDGNKEAAMNPIIHLPPSPTSDQDMSVFERDDMFRSGTDYMMAGFDSYPQPRGEVHLGNGITLYTD